MVRGREEGGVMVVIVDAGQGLHHLPLHLLREDTHDLPRW